MADGFLSPDEMRKVVNDALSDFAKRDMVLLDLGVQEETISHRLAIYIEQRLPEWEVDCEYNRDLMCPKKNPKGSGCIRPDIVVHKRNSSRNLLVVEIKKTTHMEKTIESARLRVREFTELWTHHPRYCHGVVMVFPVRTNEPKDVLCYWFHRDGCATLNGGEPKTDTCVIPLSEQT